MRVVRVITFITSILFAPSLANDGQERELSASATVAPASSSSASTTKAAVIGKNAKCDAASNNGFAKKECGTGDQKRCCHPKSEVCVGPFKPKGGKDQYVCSKNRALHGPKIIKVLMIPLFAGLLCFIFLVHMALGLRGKIPKPIKNMPYQMITPLLCIVQCTLAIFVVLSEVWKFAVYSAFLSVLVYHATLNSTKLAKWVFGLVVALQFFNCLAILGAATDTTNGVFIPLGVFAADGGTASWKKGMVDYFKGGETCSKFYDNYFTLESIETAAEKADPNQKYFGLCTDEWVTSVLSFICIKMMLQFIMAGLSAKMFADKFIYEQGGEAAEVELSRIKLESDEKLSA